MPMYLMQASRSRADRARCPQGQASYQISLDPLRPNVNVPLAGSQILGGSRYVLRVRARSGGPNPLPSPLLALLTSADGNTVHGKGALDGGGALPAAWTVMEVTLLATTTDGNARFELRCARW
jgi:hypothetical protein